MGMFDYLKSDYDIGILTGRECQTKDMDAEGGTMSFYWLDPVGNLWSTDYTGTAKIDISHKFKLIPTGTRGKVYPAYVTGKYQVYDTLTQPDGVQDLFICQLTFSLGRLQYYEYINKFIQN